MSLNYGCTGGCFESPIHYSYNHDYIWYDNDYTGGWYDFDYDDGWYYVQPLFSRQYMIERQLSEEYWADQYFPRVSKKETETSCFSFLLTFLKF